MKVICFGDSNTYGYDPRSYFGGRYAPSSRWVDILAEQTGWLVINDGLNGREIPRGPVAVPGDTDLMIVMLGTNDLLQGNGVETVTQRMERFLDSIALERHRLLLIAPPPMERGEWVPTQSLIDQSKALSRSYRALAQRMDVPVLDAGAWGVTVTYDGVHFTEEGHKAFARGLLEELRG